MAPVQEGSPIVPRMKDQGYGRSQVDHRRAWVESVTGASLEHVGRFSVPSEAMRGNIENPIGAAQVPIGVAGPLEVHGEHARGVFYVPLATTEGALVRSYERGMVALTRSGGVQARIFENQNRVAPVFSFADVAAAFEFVQWLATVDSRVKAEADSTTRHGRLERIEAFPAGRDVMVNLRFHTADAHGMNMIVKAADKACRWIKDNSRAERYLVFSGLESEKHASGFLFPGGKGKKVVAGALLPAATCRSYLHAAPSDFARLWKHTAIGHVHAGAQGYNGHFANGLTAMFIACGQDVANVVNSAIGITNFEVTDSGDLYASVTLPALTVATVGGGTGLGTGRECLEMLGCAGSGGSGKLGEIFGAAVLAGELSMGAAIVSGEFVAAHESYGRNRPKEAASEVQS
jgi:hydroxymethylglutaryl-CoA reductase (NADPH)